MVFSHIKFAIKEKGKPENKEKNLAEWGKKPTTAGIEPNSNWCETSLVLLPHHNNNNNNNNNNIY